MRFLEWWRVLLEMSYVPLAVNAECSMNNVIVRKHQRHINYLTREEMSK